MQTSFIRVFRVYSRSLALSTSSHQLSRHLRLNIPQHISLANNPIRYTRFSDGNALLWKALGIAGCTVTITFTTQAWFKPRIQCQAPPKVPEPVRLEPLQPPPPAPKPIINVYELSFGTVAGICTGVFVKKGLKTVAYFLGGFFVLVQAINSLRIIHINLSALSRPFERMFYSVDATGRKQAPTVGSFWNWLANFLTADFQPRASFLAGLVLGFRIG